MINLFNLQELNKDWVDSFYESEWTVDTLTLTQFEKDLIEELISFLPRHDSGTYDWNLPYAEMIVLIVRNLLAGKKLINTEEPTNP